MPIYTRTGDDGTTALFGGKRVLKSDPHIEVYGYVDELSSVLGMVISLSYGKKNKVIINIVQRDLYRVMSLLTGGKIQLSVLNSSIKLFEQEIDKIMLGLPKLSRFILPHGNKNTTLLHFARTVCRRTERMVVLYTKRAGLLKNTDMLLIIKYLNRLSDLLFALARQASQGTDIVV